jgi:ABC-2 type transport system permease protein
MTAPAVRRYAGLAAVLAGIGLRRLLAYRADFLVGAFGFAVRVGLNVGLLAVVFGQVRALGGWTFDQALLLLGLAITCRGLDHTVTDQLWELGRKLVQRGELVRYLIRPVNPLFTLLSERFLYPDGVGELVAGVAVAGYAVHRVDLPGPAARWLVAAGLVLCGALVYSAIKLLLASLAFWTVTSLQVMAAVYEVSETARYPLQVFPAPVRLVLVTVLPFAFTGYVPARYLLHGADALTVAAPVVAGLLLLAALAVWRRGLERFEAVGP